MRAAGALAPRARVEKSPILAPMNRHTMPSPFRPNSLKTNDSDLHKVSHFSRLGKSPENGRRRWNNSTTFRQHALRSRPPNWRRGFWSLIVTQFQTGFNDNALKFLVIYIVVAMNFPQTQRDLLVLVVGALFALPFIFFSMTGGYFADRYSKRSVTIGTKFLEIGVMAFFIVSLALHNLPMECASVFLISTEGALFGPSKYGLLPELLPEPRLSWGNGIIELGTFVASIGATMAAGVLADRYHGHEAVAGFMLLGVYLRRFGHELRNFANSGCRSHEEIPLEPSRRFRHATQDHPRRPSARLGRAWQHLSFFPGRAAAVRHRDLRARRAAHRRHAHQLSAGRRRTSASDSAASPPDIFPAEKSNTA